MYVFEPFVKIGLAVGLEALKPHYQGFVCRRAVGLVGVQECYKCLIPRVNLRFVVGGVLEILFVSVVDVALRGFDVLKVLGVPIINVAFGVLGVFQILPVSCVDVALGSFYMLYVFVIPRRRISLVQLKEAIGGWAFRCAKKRRFLCVLKSGGFRAARNEYRVYLTARAICRKGNSHSTS